MSKPEVHGAITLSRGLIILVASGSFTLPSPDSPGSRTGDPEIDTSVRRPTMRPEAREREEADEPRSSARPPGRGASWRPRWPDGTAPRGHRACPCGGGPHADGGPYPVTALSDGRVRQARDGQGPNTGVFLQITCDDAIDVPVPGQKYTFGGGESGPGPRGFSGPGGAGAPCPPRSPGRGCRRRARDAAPCPHGRPERSKPPADDGGSMTARNAADGIHGVQLEPGARKSCPAPPGWPRNDDERDGPGQQTRPDDRNLLPAAARRGTAGTSVDAVTDVVLVLNAGSYRYTLACNQRGGPR